VLDSLQREVDLLSRALQTLAFVRENEPVGIRRTSKALGYEHHEIRVSFRLLEEEGLVEATDDGAVTTDEAAAFVAAVGDDLDAVRGSLADLRSLADDEPSAGDRERVSRLTTPARR
jgi:predicted transcriptional regulator